MDSVTFEKYKRTPFYALQLDANRKHTQFMECIQQEYDWLAQVMKEIPEMLPQDEFMILPTKTPGKRKLRPRQQQASPPKINLDASADEDLFDKPLTISELDVDTKPKPATGRTLRSTRGGVTKAKKKQAKGKKLSSHSRTCTYSPRHVKPSTPSASSTPDARNAEKPKQRTLRLKRTAATKRYYLTPEKKKMFDEASANVADSPMKPPDGSMDKVRNDNTKEDQAKDLKVRKLDEQKSVLEAVTKDQSNKGRGLRSEATKTSNEDVDNMDVDKQTKDRKSVIDEKKEKRSLRPRKENLKEAYNESDKEEEAEENVKDNEDVKQSKEVDDCLEQGSAKDTKTKRSKVARSNVQQVMDEITTSKKSQEVVNKRKESSIEMTLDDVASTIDKFVTAIESTSMDFDEDQSNHGDDIVVKECRIMLSPLRSSLVRRLMISSDHEEDTTEAEEEPMSPDEEKHNETNDVNLKNRASKSISDELHNHDLSKSLKSLSKDENILVSSTPEEKRKSKKRSSRHANLSDSTGVSVKKLVLEGRKSAMAEAEEAKDEICPLVAPANAAPQTKEVEEASFITDDEWDTIDDESVSLMNQTKASMSTPQNHHRHHAGVARLAHSADGSHGLKKYRKWTTGSTACLNSSADQPKNTLSRVSNISTPGRMQRNPSIDRLSILEEERRRELNERMRKESQRLKEREQRLAREREARRVANEQRRQQVLSKREAWQREKLDSLRQQVEERDRHQMELLREKREEEQRRKLAMATMRKQLEEREREEAERKARRQREEAERKAKAELERRQKEVERKAKEEVERRLKEAERKAREDAERRHKEAKKKMKEEAERKAREEAERKAKEDSDRRVRELVNKKAKEETDRKQTEEMERRARQEAERRARVEAERKAREEAYKKAKEEERKLLISKQQQQVVALKTSSRMNIPLSVQMKPKMETDHYDISDLHSDQETDDDEQPRKKVPKWAARSEMLRFCRHVWHQKVKWWRVFRPTDTMGVDLNQMFSESTRGFRNRTSSAVWDIPPALKNNRPYL